MAQFELRARRQATFSRPWLHWFTARQSQVVTAAMSQSIFLAKHPTSEYSTRIELAVMDNTSTFIGVHWCSRHGTTVAPSRRIAVQHPP